MADVMAEFRAGERASNLTPAQAQADRFKDYYGLYRSAYAPQMQALSNQNAVYNSRIGQIGAARGQSAGAMRQGYDAQLAKINLQLEALGPERQSIHRQYGYYDDRQGIENSRFVSNMQLNNAERGYIGQLRDLLFREFVERGEGMDLESQRALQAYEYNRSREISDRIGTGGAASPGFNADLHHLGTEHHYYQQGIENQRDLLWTGLTRDLATNDITRTRAENQWANLIYDHELGKLDTNEQKARLRDREIQLDFRARELGLDKNVLAANLAQGLANLNMQHAMSVGQIMDSMASNDFRRQQLGSEIFMNALAASQMG